MKQLMGARQMWESRKKRRQDHQQPPEESLSIAGLKEKEMPTTHCAVTAPASRRLKTTPVQVRYITKSNSILINNESIYLNFGLKIYTWDISGGVCIPLRVMIKSRIFMRCRKIHNLGQHHKKNQKNFPTRLFFLNALITVPGNHRIISKFNQGHARLSRKHGFNNRRFPQPK